jgi:hypothetical protein
MSAVLYLASYLLPFDSFHNDPAAVNLLKLDGYGALFNPQHWSFTSGLLLMWLVAYMGLWHFDNWARHLYLGLTVWSLITASLYGVRVTSPFDATLGLLVDLLDGALLGLAYFSPTKELFSEKH